jgi:hypothetical protein
VLGDYDLFLPPRMALEAGNRLLTIVCDARGSPMLPLKICRPETPNFGIGILTKPANEENLRSNRSI